MSRPGKPLPRPSVSPYAVAADQWMPGGWEGLFPLEYGVSFPVPAGFTGMNGRTPGPEEIERWTGTGIRNVGLRLPTGVIALDVQSFGYKRGAETLLEHEQKYGPLPPTWRVSRDKDPVSGVRLFRFEPPGPIRAELAGGGVMVLQTTRGWVLLPPSMVNRTQVVLLDPDSNHTVQVPAVADLPCLPPAWGPALLPAVRTQSVQQPLSGEVHPRAQSPRRELDRALPGTVIDLIRDGVPGSELRSAGGRAVFNALRSTAASACQRGWDQWEWQVVVLEPNSRLGAQARMRDGRTVLPPDRLRSLFDTVWEQATEWVSVQPPPATRRELLLQESPSLVAARCKIKDTSLKMSDNDRTLLAFVCDEVERRGMNRVALPWRNVCEQTGLGQRTVQNGLARLEEAGHLINVSRGKRGLVRKAGLYRLPTPTAWPPKGAMGPDAQIYGTAALQALGTPRNDEMMRAADAANDAENLFEHLVLTVHDLDSPELREAARAAWSDARPFSPLGCLTLNLPEGSTFGEAAAEVMQWQEEVWPELVREWESDKTSPG